MIKNSHHLSFRNSQNGFSNWVSLMIYLFCKQYHTSVIILKMLFQKLSFIIKIVFVTLCSVRKMDVSLLCFKTFFGALYKQATTCPLDVHLHKVFLVIWSNDLLNGVYECYGSSITNKLWSYLVLQTGTTYKHDELCTT